MPLAKQVTQKRECRIQTLSDALSENCSGMIDLFLNSSMKYCAKHENATNDEEEYKTKIMKRCSLVFHNSLRENNEHLMNDE
ncbi:hypothetical protein T11_13843 [Trichinella zimbabwensis]|uniref:Uncharacterized protein n=1 Tax=Trichinella zimbabwensis TaxID=268475 RepID=A0A0V1HP02_9BILA|nr:hypothetical protein T11_13843 [Trichinella zimbabwensis]